MKRHNIKQATKLIRTNVICEELNISRQALGLWFNDLTRERELKIIEALERVIQRLYKLVDNE